MLSDPQVLEGVALGAAVAAALALLVAVLLAVRLRRLSRRCAELEKGAARPAGGFPTAALESLRADLDAARADLETTRSDLAGALQRVAVVRYDAFGEAGGQQSFSAALLDGSGDGLVLSGISGRAESRTYVKRLRSGVSTTPLSPEELEAVAAAVRGEQPAGPPSDRRSMRASR